MAYQFQTIPIADLGQGIDQLSAENSLKEGFSEYLLNVDPLPEGYLSKRRGYQSYAGQLPFRIQKMEHISAGGNNNLCFYLDNAIDLSTVRSTPVIVSGKSSGAVSGDFESSIVTRYYPSFTADVRRTISLGANTLTVDEDEHQISTVDIWTGITESTSTTDNSNLVLLPDNTTITKSTREVTVSLTNSDPSFTKAFIYTSNKAPAAGTVFRYDSTTTSPLYTVVALGTNTITITAAEHGLSNFNIITKLFLESPTELVEVIPDNVVINNVGTVTVTFTNNDASFANCRLYLSAAPSTNAVEGTIANNASISIPLSGLSSAFLFTGIYLAVGTSKEIVFPDSITIDAITNTANVSFTNNSGNSATFFIYWEEATIFTNKLCVTSHTSLGGSYPYEDTTVQLTLWGLLHSESYGNASSTDRNGWVTHIDTYRSAGEQRVVAGLGGNLFAAYDNGEENAVAYTSASIAIEEMPNHYPNLRGRISTNRVIGPAFFSTTDSPTRSRGYFKVLGASDGFVQATATEYLGSNLVRYTVATPSRVDSSPSTAIIANDNDYLTVKQAGYTINNGEFLITAIDYSSPTNLLITVYNPDINSADWNEVDAGMEVGVFTDRFTLSSDSPFIPNDELLSDNFDNEDNFIVVSSASSTVYLKNVTESQVLPSGLRVIGRRTSRIIPLRTILDVETVDNIVRGDVLYYTPIERLLKVTSINTLSNQSVTIVGNGTIATVSSLDTSGFRIGQRVLLVRASGYSGEQVISSIPNNTSFTFETTRTDTVSGVVVGKVVELDESLEWEDTTNSTSLIGVQRRFFPIEAPTDSWDLTPNTYYRHFSNTDYDNQAFLRSVMVSDNLYLTNGSDRVHKMDGSDLYRAGLPRWQPHLFATLTTGSGISFSGKKALFTGWSTNAFTLSTADDSKRFSIGEQLYSTQHGNTVFTITSIDDTTNKLFVDKEITGTTAAGTLTTSVSYRYYFRLNAVDRNRNIIASATAGSQDVIINVTDPVATTVNLRMVGLPAFDNFAYDTIEVEVYRTKANGPAPYYRITTSKLSFANGGAYFTYSDKSSDDTLTDLDIDPVASVLTGAELGTRWTAPLKAKYVTSAGNRLVLGNLTGEQTLDIHIEKDTSGTDITGTQLNGTEWLFRKDSTDTGTSTTNTTRVKYQMTSVAGTAYTQIVVSGGVATITGGPACNVGEWIYIYRTAAGTSDANRLFAGWHQCSGLRQFNTTVASGTYTASGGSVDRIVMATTVTDIPVYIGTNDYNYQMNGGNPSFASIEAMAIRRLANAINSTMRAVDLSLSGQSSFRPWLLAGGGNDFSSAQLVVTCPIDLSTTISLTTPSINGFILFVNDRQRAASQKVDAFTPSYPSRIIASYPNYPELFENPTAVLDSQSQSAVDVNSADGQQITGIIPFFGDTAFGASLRGGVVVVFKTNSIYLVDLSQKAVGANAVQKLESRGLGCTAPYSIAPAKDGIIFANESGIYKLTRNLTVEYVGRFVERIWKEEVSQDNLPLFHGTYYGINNQYKVSIVNVGDNKPTRALVYNTVREYNSQAGMGSWTLYDAHPTIGWANLNQDAFFASTAGEVFILRNTGLKTDFRDDSSPINMEATLRATDFGEPARRKLVGSVIIDFRVDDQDDQNIGVLSTIDFNDAYDQLDSFKVTTGNSNQSGLNDEPGYRIRSIQFSIVRRRCLFIQTKITDNTIDQSVDIARVSYRVAGLEDTGVLEAKDTNR